MKNSVLAKLALLVLLVVGIAGAMAMKSPTSDAAAPVYEIRSYHIDPPQLEAYKTWISTYGLPHIRKNMDVVGFWVKGDLEGDVSGAPMDALGSANVTWIINWESKAARDETMGKTFGTPEWEEIFAKFPGGREAYLRTEVRFFEGI